MKKQITVLLGMLFFVTFLYAQTISSYSIITTGSVLKGGTNGSLVLTQPMYEKLVAEQSALKTNDLLRCKNQALQRSNICRQNFQN